MKQKIFYGFFFAACLLNAAANLYPKSVYLKQIGKSELELEVDAYYTPLGFYQPLTSAPIPYLEEENELGIYKILLASPVPRFIVFEASVNPMPCLGALIKKQSPRFYGNMSIGDDFNLIRSVCAGFEEPYAASIFLGNVVNFAPKEKSGAPGKGFIGLLISGGNYHIKDNEIITDNWIESEIKLKGDRQTAKQKISWSCRGGAKFHNNVFIKDALYFSVRRDRTDYAAAGFSIFKNSNLEYIVDIDAKSGAFIRHYFLAGKKFPFKNKKLVFSLGAGVLWEGSDKYTGALKRPEENAKFQLLIRPNVEF